MIESREELRKIIHDKCYKHGDFTLSSGQKSEHYINLKPITLSGAGLEIISILMLAMVDKECAAVAGLTLGADPLVSGTALIGTLHERPLDALIVRKEAKGHGTGAWIEGPELPKGSKVTVLEDVITTGGSAIKAVDRLRDAGYIVERIVAIVDRQVSGEADINMAAAHLEMFSLYDLTEISDGL